jgi:hypothetical protein
MKAQVWGARGLLGTAGLCLATQIGPLAGDPPPAGTPAGGARSLLVLATTANRGEVDPCG